MINKKYYQKGKIIFKGGRLIELQYHNSKVKKLCQDYKKVKKELNVEVAEKLHSLIDVLESADNLWDINIVYRATRIVIAWEVTNHYE